VVAPLAREQEATDILSSLDWPIAPPAGEWRPVSRAFVTSFIGIMIPATIATLAAIPFLGPIGLLWIAGGLLAIGVRWFDWKRTRYALGDNALFIETGWWRHRRSIIPMRKIQSVDLAESWWSRMFGIGTLRIGVAGGSGFSDHQVPALARPQAEALRAELLA
jgi:putative membrane protein